MLGYILLPCTPNAEQRKQLLKFFENWKFAQRSNTAKLFAIVLTQFQLLYS